MEVAPLYHALLYREVPKLQCNCFDIVKRLYEELDQYNEENREWMHTHNAVLYYLVYAKASYKTYDLRCHFNNTNGEATEQIEQIYTYYNNNLIVRRYAPYWFKDTKYFCQYFYYDHIGDYLLELSKKQINLDSHYILRELCSEINYEKWLLKKYIVEARKKRLKSADEQVSRRAHRSSIINAVINLERAEAA